MPYPSGNVTKNVYRYGPEVHKLHLEFKVNGAIKAGQPVILDIAATTERTVKAFVPGNNATAVGLYGSIIGYALQDGSSAYGAYIVVAVRGYAVVEAVADGAVIPGPVAYSGYTAQGDINQPLEIDDPSGQSQFGTPATIGDLKYKNPTLTATTAIEADLLASNGFALTAAATTTALLVLLK